MARFLARMTAALLCFSTLLLAVNLSILTLTRLVTSLLARVGTTFECLIANKATDHIRSPTRLILQCLLTTQAHFLCQIWTARTTIVLDVAIMGHCWMTAALGSLTWKCAWWRLRTTRQRRLKSCSSATARDILKDSLSATVASAFMAQVRTSMVATFQQTPTSPGANMFRFDTVVDPSSHSQGLQFPFCCLSFN